MEIPKNKNAGELMQEHEDRLCELEKRGEPQFKIAKGLIQIISIYMSVMTLKQLLKK